MLKFLAFIGLLAILGAVAAGVYFFGGYYNVASTAAESDLVASALVRIRAASIERHASDNAPSSLNDPAMVQAGARAFSERGCVHCHGGPGVEWAKYSEGLHPDPPDLKELANELAPQALFWVIKNGINMTGMPSFGVIGVPDQEIWSIVAFVKKLPSVSDADFKTWTAPAAPPPAPAGSLPAAPSPPSSGPPEQIR
jgi:mono/diheme cytochrome c family protein